jgi:hypothetical protein
MESKALERAIEAFRKFTETQTTLMALTIGPEELMKFLQCRGSCIITVTPSLARWILDNMGGRNRDIVKATVDRYAEAMKKPNGWRVTGQGLIFNRAGKLDDGQHRLSACIQAEVPFQTFVVFGMEEDIFKYLDDNKPRRGSDIFKINGVPLYEPTANAMRWLMVLRSEGNNKKRVSNDDKLDFYIEHVREVDKVEFMRECAETALQLVGVGGFPKGILAALLFEAGEKHGEPKAQKVMQDLKLNKGEARIFRENYGKMMTGFRDDKSSLTDTAKLRAIAEGVTACIEERRVSVSALMRATNVNKPEETEPSNK